MKTALPLFYFKPTICCIDDDQIFLDAISLYFKDRFNCLTFNNPQTAIDFFASYTSPLVNINFQREFTESDIFGTNNHFPVDINLNSIRNLITMPQKMHEIALLIVDYHMPQTNGVEICAKLKSLPFKKMLLTGEATHEKGIAAFNEGLIDKFIRKDHDIADRLTDEVTDLIDQYFEMQSAKLISHLEASKPSLLTDIVFINFFNDWRHKNDIREFYLINKQGCFLAKNNANETLYLIVMSEHDKAEFLKLNDELLDEAGHLLNQVAAGSLLPFFGEGCESWDYHVSEWDKFFYPGEVLVGREKYYWAVIQ